MYNLYIYDIRELSDEQYRIWYDRMGSAKKKRVDRFKIGDDKKRTVVADAIARRGISEACNVSESDISFTLLENGKPIVEHLDIHFNVSHSHNIVVCAVSPKNIGIDIENIRPVSAKFARRVCKENELYTVFNCDGNVISKELFKVWTAKEAYFKLIGTGITNFKAVDTHDLERLTVIDSICGYIISVIVED